MKAHRSTILIIGLLLTLCVTIVFILFLQDFLRTAVLDPVITGYYTIRWYALRLPELCLWIIATLVASLFLLRAYLRVFARAPRHPHSRVLSVVQKDDLESLAELVGQAHYDVFSRVRLARELATVAIRMIACKEGVSLGEARLRFETASWCERPTVREFFDCCKLRYGMKRARNFGDKLEQTISFLEDYQQGAMNADKSRKATRAANP